MMSDETVNYDTNEPGQNGPAGQAGTAEPAAERVGFCQDCGTPLTKETLRSVGSGVFCEPCLHARVGAPAPGAAAYPVPPIAGQPHPWLAGLLGLIPGVGAMYNGQYAKGIVHLIVFAVLQSLNEHVSGIFGLFVAGWVFYQIFEAYATAKARLEGLPLPNPFGFNDIGERMGFGKGWTYTGSGWSQTTPPPAAGTTAGTTAPPAGVPYTAPVSSGPDWVGYVPPTNFASAPVPPPPAAAQAWGQAPYAQTYSQTYAPPYTPAAGAAYVPPMPVAPLVPVTPVRRFPVGALWLVGLGLVFLLAGFAPEWGWDWDFSGRWLLPVLFAGLAVWTFTRRLAVGLRSVRALRGAIILMTLAVLFAFQAADLAGLKRTWPVFLIVLGVLLIAERTALNTVGFAAASAASPSFVPPTQAEAEAAAERTRAAWSTSEAASEAPLSGIEKSQAESAHPDTTKGGY
jgi:TM2 domain-containing membrane protein YozV